MNPKLTEQSAFSPKLIQKCLALYRIEKVLTDSNYLIRKVGTIFTQNLQRIRLRPITPQYCVDDIADINPQNSKTDPSWGKYRGEQDCFDKIFADLLENEKHNVYTAVDKNFGIPRQSFYLAWNNYTTTNNSTNPAYGSTSRSTSEKLGTNPTVAPRGVLTPPEHLTAPIPDSSEESDESVEPIEPLWRSQRLQDRNQNRYQNLNFFEAAGQQLRKTQIKQTSIPGWKKTNSYLCWPLNVRRKQHQQMQFVQGTGAQQSGSDLTKPRPDLIAIEDDTWRNIRIVTENLFSRNCSMGHCVLQNSPLPHGSKISSKT